MDTGREKAIANRAILVTGGTGTVGRALVRQLLPLEPRVVRIFSRDEMKHFYMMNEFAHHSDKLRFLVGDVRDEKRLQMAMDGIDIVFHLAAMKHVLLSSYNPFEAMKTNIIGTQNVIECALRNNVKRVIFASTDKAVNPTSTMGVTKLAAEHLVTVAGCYRGPRPAIFASVRFGNVLGSRGSAIPLFVDQINRGLPVTITDPEMTRFIITSSRACQLLIEACHLARGGEIFVLKMPKVRLCDLVDALFEHFNAPPNMEVITQFPYEKMDEELMTSEESSRGLESDEMFIILPPALIRQMTGIEYTYPMALRPARQMSYCSGDGPFLSKAEILGFLGSNHILEEKV